MTICLTCDRPEVLLDQKCSYNLKLWYLYLALVIDDPDIGVDDNRSLDLTSNSVVGGAIVGAIPPELLNSPPDRPAVPLSPSRPFFALGVLSWSAANRVVSRSPTRPSNHQRPGSVVPPSRH